MRDTEVPGKGRKLWLGLDLGATNGKGAVIDDEGHVLAYESAPLNGERLVPESASVSEVVAVLAACGRGAVEASGASWRDIAGVGVGTPGAVRDGGECMAGSGNLFNGAMVPLRRLVAEALGVAHVVLLNDADAAMHAELWVGAARDADSAALLTLGTGVGCGIAINGRVVRGATGTMEGGHMIVRDGGRRCPCGGRGCLEAHASATAVAALYRERTAPSDSVSCADVFARAEAGDPVAVAVVDETARAVALGAVNLVRIVDPDVVVLAGGVTQAGTGFLDKVRAHALQLSWTCLPSRHDAIVLAAAGPHTGCLGAAKAARDTWSSSPPLNQGVPSRSRPPVTCSSCTIL